MISVVYCSNWWAWSSVNKLVIHYTKLKLELCSKNASKIIQGRKTSICSSRQAQSCISCLRKGLYLFTFFLGWKSILMFINLHTFLILSDKSLLLYSKPISLLNILKDGRDLLTFCCLRPPHKKVIEMANGWLWNIWLLK